MKISPNEPSMPIKDVGFMPDEDGGQIAFATTQGAFNANFTGLTIRAELAARAMQGILSFGAAQRKEGGTSTHPDDIAIYAVACADALISELNKTSTNEQ